MSDSVLADIIVYAVLAGLAGGIVYAIKKGFRSGNATTVYGATAELYTKDKKAAMEVITEQRAKKKMEEQDNGLPE